MTTPTPSAPRSTTRPGDPTMTAEELARDWEIDPRWSGVRRDHSAEGPYRPEDAQLKATARRARTQIGKLMASPPLRKYVVEALRAQWSPEEIAGRILP